MRSSRGDKRVWWIVRRAARAVPRVRGVRGAAGAARTASRPRCGSCVRARSGSCGRAGARPIPRWPGYDFNLKAELCRLCASEVLWSGHRFCVWFCRPCHGAVREANERLGRVRDPGGSALGARRSAGQPPPGAAQGTRRVTDLVGFMTGLAGRMEALERWRAGRVAGLLVEKGLTSPSPLDTYLDVASRGTRDRRRLVELLVSTLAA